MQVLVSAIKMSPFGQMRHLKIAYVLQWHSTFEEETGGPQRVPPEGVFGADSSRRLLNKSVANHLSSSTIDGVDMSRCRVPCNAVLDSSSRKQLSVVSLQYSFSTRCTTKLFLRFTYLESVLESGISGRSERQWSRIFRPTTAGRESPRRRRQAASRHSSVNCASAPSPFLRGELLQCRTRVETMQAAVIHNNTGVPQP